MKKWNFLFIRIVIVLIPLYSGAQEIQLDELKKQFPGEHALTLRSAKLYTISFKDKKPSVSGEVTEESIALTDKGVPQISLRNIYSGAFIKGQLKEAHTRSLNEKGKYKNVTATHIVQKSDLGNNIFFDDQQTTEINFPAVTTGSTTLLRSTEEFKDIRMFGQFFFSHSLTTIESEVTVKVDKNIQLKYVEENFKGTNIRFSLTTKGKYNCYTWKVSNMPKIRSAERAPGIRCFIPHLIFYISGYQVNGITVPVLESPKDLYAWYSKLVHSVNCAKSNYLAKICDSITRDCHSEFEKVKKLFYWVQDNIKYIAFEEGYGGYVPREALQVYEKRYGDCKDLSSIITYMLKLSGIKSSLTWIGTRDIPYTYESVPSPITDNHMIAAYRDSTGKIWLLDGTGKNATINLYTSMIQGKQALIGTDSTHFELYSVPVIPKEKNATYDSVMVNINGSLIEGSGLVRINGYPKIDMDYLRCNTGQDEFKDYIKEYLSRGNNTFQVSSYDMYNTESREVPTELRFHFKLNNYIKTYQDETYFNFHLGKDELKYTIDNSRENVPLEIKHTIDETTCVEFELPANSECSYLPGNSTFSKPDYGFSIEYSKTEKSVRMRKHFFCNKLLIPPSEFEQWKEFLNTLNKAYNESIILKHKN